MEPEPVFSISYKDITYSNSSPPKTYEDIIVIIKAKWNLQPNELINLALIYKDEEDDDILISSQYDYEEALFSFKSKKVQHMRLTLDNSLNQSIPFLLQEAIKDPIRSLPVIEPPIDNNTIANKKLLETQLLEKQREEERVKALRLNQLQLLIATISKYIGRLFRSTLLNIQLTTFLQEAERERVTLERRRKVIESIRSEIKQKQQQELVNSNNVMSNQQLSNHCGLAENSTNVNSISKVHKNTKCDNCNACPIIGIRFKCSECLDYNLCEKCETLNIQSKQHGHLFIIIRDPLKEKYSFSIRKNHKVTIRRSNKKSMTIHQTIGLRNTGEMIWFNAELECDREASGSILCDSVSLSNILPDNNMNIPLELEVPYDIADGNYFCYLKLKVDGNVMEDPIRITIQIISNI